MTLVEYVGFGVITLGSRDEFYDMPWFTRVACGYAEFDTPHLLASSPTAPVASSS